jgi:hypothetical protein
MWRRAIRPRSKPRPGRLKGTELEALRLECFKRDKGRCVDCDNPVTWEMFHMAHVGAKRRYGDSLENVVCKCHGCHWKEHTGGKVVPAKVRD